MPKQKNLQNKPVKPTLRIFCEGEKTEPLYLNAFIESLGPSLFGKAKIERTSKNTPVQLVEEAIKNKENGDLNDIYWVVYDRESVTKYPHELHLKAKQKAESNDINIAFSNVCFEFWLLLHFELTTAPYQNCDDLLSRSDLKKYLRDIGIKKYDKAMAIIFDKIKDNVSIAENNAKSLRKSVLSCAEEGKKEPYHLNPYVDVDILLDNIRNFINPFNDNIKKAFKEEFIQYYSLKLSHNDWMEYIRTESRSSVIRLTQTIERYCLSIILQTLIENRYHEINQLLEYFCGSKWVKEDNDWIMYKNLLEMIRNNLLNKQ